MKVNAEELITDLIERTRQVLNDSEKLNQLPVDTLNWKTDSNSWSALECIEHLNLYGDFYMPEIKTRIEESPFAWEPVFKSGLLGNYFAKVLAPQERLNKMKTFKDKNPIGSALDKTAIQRFINQQHQTLELLEMARRISLNRTKTGISISKWLKLKLGDTFRVVIYHNQRHLEQAFSVLSAEKLVLLNQINR